VRRRPWQGSRHNPWPRSPLSTCVGISGRSSQSRGRSAGTASWWEGRTEVAETASWGRRWAGGDQDAAVGQVLTVVLLTPAGYSGQPALDGDSRKNTKLDTAISHSSICYQLAEFGSLETSRCLQMRSHQESGTPTSVYTVCSRFTLSQKIKKLELSTL
jgi:hypothetical protein